MKAWLFRIIGKILTFIGAVIFLFTTSVVIIWAGHPDPLTIAEIYAHPSTPLLVGFIPIGFFMICDGILILRRYEEVIPFLTKDGEQIHSGKPWKKGSESGLFLTSCGRVVSINQESSATAHVGYKIVTAKRATHSDCTQKEGGAILENVVHRRSH